MQFIKNTERNTKLTESQTEYLFQLITRCNKQEAGFKKRIGVWKKAIQGMQLKLKRGGSPQKIDLTVNLAYAHLRSKLPALFFQEPTVIANPRRKEDAESAPVWQKFLNNIIRRNGYKRETKRATNSAIISGEGWKKIVVSQDGASGQTTAARGGGGTIGSGPQTEAGTGPSEWSDKMLVSSVWVPSEDVIVDYQATGRDIDGGNCRFIIVRYLKNLAELQVDPRYIIPNELDYSRFVTNRDGVASHPGHNRELGGKRTDAEEDQVYVYEVWVHQLIANTEIGATKPDLKMYKQMVVLMDGAKRPIREPLPWSDFYGESFPGWPVHKFELNQMPNAYPISEFEAWYQLQQAINFVMSRALDQIANNGPVDIVSMAAVENPDMVIRDLDKAKSRTTVKVKSGRAADALHRIPSIPIQNDLFTILGPLISLTERVSGSSRNRQQQTGIRTATEARNVESATQIVEGEHIDTIRDFLKADVTKLTAVLKVFADSDYVDHIVGETGPIPWDEGFSAENIKTLPEIEIEVDSFRSPFENRLQQKWTTILQFSLSLLPFMPSIRVDVIYNKWLESMKVDSGAIMGSTDDDRIKQMMEIMSMMNGGEYIEAQPNENHQAELEVLRNFKNSDVYKNAEPQVQQMLGQHEDQHLELQEMLGDTADEFAGRMKGLGMDPNNPPVEGSREGISTPQEGLGA